MFQYLKNRDPAKAKKQPFLVVCPLSVLSSWMNEAKKWIPEMNVVRFHGPKGEREKLKDEVLALEQNWRDIIHELQDGKLQLEVILSEGEERIKAIEEAKAGMFDFCLSTCALSAVRHYLSLRCLRINYEAGQFLQSAQKIVASFMIQLARQ